MIDAHDKCPMYWYLKYRYDGTGIMPDAPKSPHLSIGVAIDWGIEELFKGNDINTVAKAAPLVYAADIINTSANQELAKLILGSKLTQEWNHVIEAMLRLWHKVRYPVLLDRYEVVSGPTGQVPIVTQLSDTLALYARPDQIFRDREDGRFYNWSLKTERSHSPAKHPAALIDTGGLTEAITMAMAFGQGDLKNIAGTLMEYLVIGQPDDDEPIVWNHAIRGWRQVNDQGGYNYAWRYKYDNPKYDPDGPKDSKKNPQTISLGKGWERCAAVDYPGGIATWIDDLVAGRFTPCGQDPIKELIKTPAPYTRTASKVVRFVTKLIGEYSGLEARCESVANGDVSVYAAFPQRFCNCLRYGEDWRCEMWQICHEDLSNPIGNGFVKRRRHVADKAAQEEPDGESQTRTDL